MPTIFITGVSSGIGNGTAKVFAHHGWNVAGTVLDLNEDIDLKHMENVKLYELNVLDHERIPETAEQVIADFGTVDVVMNNAGMGLLGPVECGSYDQILKILKVNLLGYIMVAKAFLPHLRKNGKGTIVNMGAANGKVIHPGLDYYCISKAAVASMSEALLMELLPFGIDVKLIEPTGVKSNLGSTGTEMLRNDLPEYKYFFEQQFPATMRIVGGEVPGHPGSHYDPIEATEMGEIIYDAVVSGTKQFRFNNGPHAQMLFDDKAGMTEQEYIEFYRDYFKAIPGAAR